MAARRRTIDQRGSLMIEVLVTMAICTIALWALVRVQGTLQLSQMEAYQRTQALLLLEDMRARIELNHAQAADYLTDMAAPLGAGSPGGCPDPAADLAGRDLAEWCRALLGAAESRAGKFVGGMLGARGCIEALGDDTYRITLAWQGMLPLDAPPSGIACGRHAFDRAGSACVADRCRRVLGSVVRIGRLQS